METFALIPVKKLSKSKERLSGVLKPEERRRFVLFMLEDILRAILSSRLYRTVVVGLGPIVRQTVENFGADFLPETRSGLNNALEDGTSWCVERGAGAILILPVDIPLITEGDINEIIHLSSEKVSVVISPSEDKGTNALLRRPPKVIKTYFGLRSFEKHIDEASRKGVTVKVYRSPRVSLDIDSTQDLKRFLKVEERTASHRFLEQIKIDERLKSKP